MSPTSSGVTRGKFNRSGTWLTCSRSVEAYNGSTAGQGMADISLALRKTGNVFSGI